MNQAHASGTIPNCARRQTGRPHLIRALLAAFACCGLWFGAAHAQTADSGNFASQGTPARPLQVAANGPVQLTIGMAAAAPAVNTSASRGPNCTGPAREPEHVMVPLGKSAMVQLPEPVRSRTVGNPNIVQASLVSPQTLYLLGLDIGSTNMIVQGRSGSCSIIDVVVGADPGGLQATLAELIPQARNVRVTSAADNLVLTGSIPDSVNAQRVVELANAFVQRASPSPLQGRGGAQGAAPAAPGGRNIRVINMMSVSAPQQVMLEVKVAEVSKTLIDQFGAAANLNGSFGSWTLGLLANFLSGSAGVINASKANNLPLNLSIDAQKGDGLVKILAEPNLMAISGQEASFLAGGKIFIPVAQGNGTGGTTITLQEEQFGVGLKFTPTVLEGGRINLKVAPEVSELSPTGVALTAPNISGTTILPLITTRRAATTLQLNDGQSFAIGGLIKSNVTGSLKALPAIGEVPVLGALFRSTNFQEDKTELVFVVTPHLVKPLPANYPLPTDSFGTPNEAAVYLNGNMEGTKARPALPKSAAPAASAPATAVPTTSAPATATPTTVAPTTAVPVPPAPAAVVPTTVAPTTAAPVPPAPTTSAPVSSVPVISTPVTSTPIAVALANAVPVATAVIASASPTSAPVTSEPVVPVPVPPIANRTP